MRLAPKAGDGTDWRGPNAARPAAPRNSKASCGRKDVEEIDAEEAEISLRIDAFSTRRSDDQATVSTEPRR